MDWQLQDAKNQFSKVVQLASSEGPQTVTLRGEPAAVVLSIKDYNNLRADKPSFIDHLMAGPVWDDELVEEINKRSKSPSRANEF